MTIHSTVAISMYQCVPMVRLEASLSDMTEDRRIGATSSSCRTLAVASLASFSLVSFCRRVGDDMRLRDLLTGLQ